MSNDAGKAARTVSERAIADAKQRLDDAVRNYDSVHQVVGEGSAQLEQARKTLHITVLDLHQRLKNHSKGTVYWDPNPDDFDDEDKKVNGPIWTGEHPLLGQVAITGLKDLNSWRGLTRLKKVDLPGPKHESTMKPVDVRLPTDASLAVADVLIEVYEMCGFDAEQAVTEHWEEEPI